jgi:hypothetical protein
MGVRFLPPDPLAAMSPVLRQSTACVGIIENRIVDRVQWWVELGSHDAHYFSTRGSEAEHPPDKRGAVGSNPTWWTAGEVV